MAERLRDGERTPGALATRGDFVVRGAYVVTMDPALGDQPNADVLVRNGEIVAIGKHLAAERTQAISGEGMMLLPGFVDTHWPLWNSFILVRMTDLNMAPCGDPVDVLVLSGMPQNVDTVIADGRVLKRGGKFVGFDARQIVIETHESVTRILEAAGWEVPPWWRPGGSTV